MNETTRNSKKLNKENIGENIFSRNNYALEALSVEDGRISKTKYGTFIWFLDYTKLFVTRLARDLMYSVLSYVYSGQLLPKHTIDLMHAQKILQAERELVTTTYSSTDIEIVNKIEVCANCSEIVPEIDFGHREYVLGSKLSLVESTTILFINISQDVNIENPAVGSSRTNEISINETQNKKDIKASSATNMISVTTSISIQENKEKSESSIEFSNIFSSRVLETHNLPTEVVKSLVRGELDIKLKIALEFLHRDNEFLIAAELGDDVLLEKYIKQGENIQQMDHLGRNALHLAVCSENEHAITLLLDAGVNPNHKDNVGMTPLSLNLMRSPSLRIATLLFNHGANVLPRVDPTDTGLFLQFLMMCKPSEEEEKIIKLMIEKGSLVNDPEAPGGRQALHFAAMSNNCRLIKLLVNLGADKSMTNHRNETPLEVANTFKCKEAIQCLNDPDSV